MHRTAALAAALMLSAAPALAADCTDNSDVWAGRAGLRLGW